MYVVRLKGRWNSEVMHQVKVRSNADRVSHRQPHFIYSEDEKLKIMEKFQRVL